MPCDQTFFKVCEDFAFQNEVWKSTNHTHRSGYQIQWGDEKPLFSNESFHFLFWIFFFKPFYFTIDGYKFSFMFNWAKKEKVLDLNMLMRINVAMVNQDCLRCVLGVMMVFGVECLFVFLFFFFNCSMLFLISCACRIRTLFCSFRRALNICLFAQFVQIRL